MLEERLEAAEMRAAKAESQVKQLQTQQAAEDPEIKAAQGNMPVEWTGDRQIKEKCHLTNLLLSGYGD
ncbi:hypothetical protein ACLB1E_04515 [Escherichia coli]